MPSFRDLFSQLDTLTKVAQGAIKSIRKEDKARVLEEKKKRKEEKAKQKELELEQERKDIAARLAAKRAKIFASAEVVPISKKIWSLARIQKILARWSITYYRLDKNNILIPGPNLIVYNAYRKVYGINKSKNVKLKGLAEIKEYIKNYRNE